MTTSNELVCGTQVQLDRSGVGHNWANASADDLPANIRQEIEGEMIDGGKESCDDYTASNGLHYRWISERDAAGADRLTAAMERQAEIEAEVGDCDSIDYGKPVLYCDRDGGAMRNATAAELAESKAAAESDGGAGVIEVDGVDCYVQE